MGTGLGRLREFLVLASPRSSVRAIKRVQWPWRGRERGSGSESIRYERFSAQTRRVLARANDEARRLSHAYVGTEHFLLGIVQETDCVAARLLSRMDVELDTVRFAIDSIVEGSEDSYRSDLHLTPAAKNAIVAAVEECRLSDDPFIGTEHLLIGIVRDGRNVAADVLESLGVSLDTIRAELSQAPP